MATGREALAMNTDGSPRPARRMTGGGWDGKLRIHGLDVVR